MLIIELDSIEDVYDITVKDNENFYGDGILVHNCAEIALPTIPFAGVMDLYSHDSKGEIGLCNLMAICAGKVTPSTYEKAAYYSLLMIDNVIDIMDYPFPSLETTERRAVQLELALPIWHMIWPNVVLNMTLKLEKITCIVWPKCILIGYTRLL